MLPTSAAWSSRTTSSTTFISPITGCGLWLLQSSDRAGSDTVNLTLEFLAEMIGVRRTSVTEVATRMQGAGIITYSRGVIRILNRPALEKASCACYQTLVDQAAVLLAV